VIRRAAVHNYITSCDSGLIPWIRRGNLHLSESTAKFPDRNWIAMTKNSALQILHRIRAEYLEMPGVSLTPEQVQRLCGVERTACDTALETLVDDGFLSVRVDGTYGRFRNPEISRARPAKASLEPSVFATMSPVRAS